MFSDVIEVYAGDGHSIFDMKSHTRLNECYPHNKKMKSYWQSMYGWD